MTRDTLSLVKTIGLPSLIEGETPPLCEAYKILELAKLNKIPLLYLESLRNYQNIPYFETHLTHYRNKYKKTMDLIALVSTLFKEHEIQYTLFKTLRPFPYTPSDIDVLLPSSIELNKASKILARTGLKTLDRDLYGLTMFSADHDLNVDLTTEVAVSSFIYLDKDLLFKHTMQVQVAKSNVQVLKPYADLIAVTAHSVYKEQMYTLNDYYTLTSLSQYYTKASEFSKIIHTSFAFQEALKITYKITNFSELVSPLTEAIENTLKKFGVKVETQNKCFYLPTKYPPNILLKAISKKVLEDSVSRNSLPTALKSTLQPKAINKILNHMTRKGY